MLGGEMGDLRPGVASWAAAGLAVLTLSLSVDISARAGNRLYDMSRLLSEPHPFVAAPPTAASNPSRSAPASAPRDRNVPAFTRDQAPLPGSRYLRPSRAPTPGTSPGLQAGRQVANPAAAKTMVPQKGADSSSGSSWLSELVVGGLVHDPGEDHREADTFDINFEAVFRKVTFWSFENRFLKFLFSPHPILGGTINTDNETHTGYLALGWQYVFESGVFIGGSFGFTYHSGNLHRPTRDCQLGDSCTLPGLRSFFDDGDVYLGSRILFRESIELGYRFAGRHGVSVYLAHMSNAGLFDDDNDGMNFAGLRYRYAFD